jgi:hypothetical protein
MNNHPSQNDREPLAIELLVSADHRRPRRVTVADHERFHRTLEDPHREDAGIEDLLAEIRDPSPVEIKPSRLKR